MLPPELTHRHRLRLLGHFGLTVDGRHVSLPPRIERLIALLGLVEVRSRRDVATTLWPDLDPGQGLATLRTMLWRTRRVAGGLVMEEGHHLRLASVTIDHTELIDWIRLSSRDSEVVVPAPFDAPAELLPAWDEPWLDEEREQLRLLQLSALEATARRLLAVGRLAEACRHALIAVHADPFRDSAIKILVEVHLREGNDYEALRRFRRYERLLAAERIRPSASLRSIVAPLLAPVPGDLAAR